MRGAPPDDRMAQGTLGGVVGGFDTRAGDETPQRLVQGQQMAAGFSRALTIAQNALSEPKADVALDGRELGQEVGTRERSVPHARPEGQQIFGLQLQVVADDVGLAAPLQDFLEVAQQMAPAHLTLAGREPVVAAVAVGPDQPL